MAQKIVDVSATGSKNHVYTTLIDDVDNYTPMRNLVISQRILEKLASKHQVDRREVEQCFENIDGPLLIDTREEHQTDPQTLWFISRTNKNRLLKVAYIQKGSLVLLKSCFEPNEDEMKIYLSHIKRRTA